MNDLGVSLHSHNEAAHFLAAAQALARDFGLTLDARYLTPGFNPSRDDSPLVGVERTIPRFATPGLAEYEDRTYIAFQGSLAEYSQIARTRLMRHIRERWDVTRPTLVSHSSGYDSRILSSCLTELRDDGFDLGTIHFRCREPEGAAFLRIMERQGWEPSQYSVFEAPAEDPFDVGAWDRPGVAAWLPVVSQINHWRDIVPYDEEPDWNLLGGSGGGEAFEYPSQPKPPSVPWDFCANAPLQRWFGYFPDGTDFAADVEARFAKVMFPYFGEGHIRTVAELNDDFLGFRPDGCDNIRGAILDTFKDSTLDIPRAPRTYDWAISARRWADMRDNYARSAFLRDVPGAPDADALIAEMQAEFFKGGRAERIWRLAALWETL